MVHLTCETRFLVVFVFLISLVHHHHPALLHRQALILDLLVTFLMALCASCPRSLSLLKYVVLDLFVTFCLAKGLYGDIIYSPLIYVQRKC